MNSSAMERAEEFQANLPLEFPSFVRYIRQSYISCVLTIPKSFCNMHLPDHDAYVTLVDENEKEYTTKFLINHCGLSSGWRRFSVAHKLIKGDVLVCQLIDPCKLKVYIMRADDSTEVDGISALQNLDSAKPNDAVKLEVMKAAAQGHPESCKLDSNHGDNQDNQMVTFNGDHMNRSGDGSNNLGSEVPESVRFSQSAADFKVLKSFEGFNIVVGGLVIDSEIPMHIRKKYYELCCIQKSYLHVHLVGGLNCKLAAGIISETVNIADAIRAAKFTTSLDHLETWDKTLKAFEDLGLAVGFLRERLHKLVSISCELQKKTASNVLKRTQVEEEIRILESKLLNAKEVMRVVEAETEALKVESNQLELAFNEAASAPW